MEEPATISLVRKHLLRPGEQQPYEYVVVIDLEATCEVSRNSQTSPQEVIEFPAVLLAMREERVVAEFHQYVRPGELAVLSEFCKQLTGISQEQVDVAEPFEIVLEMYLGWLQEFGLDPQQQTGPSYIVVTHGDWDLREMLPRQMEMSGVTGNERLDVPCLRRWINLNSIVEHALGVTPRDLPRAGSGVEALANHLGVAVEGRLHSGIDDARNIARLLLRMLRFGIRFTPLLTDCHRCGTPGHYARDCPQEDEQHKHHHHQHPPSTSLVGASPAARHHREEAVGSGVNRYSLNASAPVYAAHHHGGRGGGLPSSRQQQQQQQQPYGGWRRGRSTAYDVQQALHQQHLLSGAAGASSVQVPSSAVYGSYAAARGTQPVAMAVRQRPGDWFCPSCGTLVFARRPACLNCGVLRPSVTVPDPAALLAARGGGAATGSSSDETCEEEHRVG